MSKTFQKIPKSLVRSDIRPKEVYLYAKLAMLSNSHLHYDMNTIGHIHWIDANGVSHLKREMAKSSIELYVEHLKKLHFIKVGKFYKEGMERAFNDYQQIDLKNYESVTNDFINHTELSADEKGFAIILNLLGSIPASYRLMESKTGLDHKTCKKYYLALEAMGIIENGHLSNQYFPDNKEAEYRQRRDELLKIDATDKIRSQIEWLETKMDSKYNPYSWGLKQLDLIAAGLFGKKEIDSEKTECNIIL